MSFPTTIQRVRHCRLGSTFGADQGSNSAPKHNWVKADIWKRLFDAVSDDPDMEYAMVDATIVKVHRHGQGAKGGLKAKRLAVRKAA
jgi:transposase